MYASNNYYFYIIYTKYKGYYIFNIHLKHATVYGVISLSEIKIILHIFLIHIFIFLRPVSNHIDAVTKPFVDCF